MTHRRIALALSYITVAYNVMEGLVAVVYAMRSGSPALLGFGIDSFVESLSGAVMVWRFSHPHDDKRREQTAIRLVGISLITLAAYVAYEAAIALYYREPPDRSPVGLIIAALSLVVMPVLYIFKCRTASGVKKSEPSGRRDANTCLHAALGRAASWKRLALRYRIVAG